MALIDDITEVSTTLVDYLTVKERDRDFIETSSLYGAGGSQKGANYNLKEFTRYNQDTGVNETFYMSPVEYKETFGSGPYLTEDPYEQIKDVKEYTHNNTVTGEQIVLNYNEETLQNEFKARGIVNPSIEDINVLLGELAQNYGQITTPGVYDVDELNEISQTIFSLFSSDDFKKQHYDSQVERGLINPNLIDFDSYLRMDDSQVGPVSTDEAKFYIDIMRTAEDYTDYTQDDMILGQKNIKERYKEITALLDTYRELRMDGDLSKSEVKFLQDKYTDITDRYETLKTEKFKVDKEGQGAYELQEDKDLSEVIHERYGEDLYLYTSPDGQQKIAKRGANELSGSPVEGWTPIKLSSEKLEDVILQTNASQDNQVFMPQTEDLDVKDKSELKRYTDLITFYREKIGALAYKDESGGVRTMPFIEYFYLNDAERKEVNDQMTESLKQQLTTMLQHVSKEDLENLNITAVGIMSNFALFNDLHDKWAFMYDPNSDQEGNENNAKYKEFGNKYKGDIKKIDMSTIDYLKVLDFDPSLEEQVDPSRTNIDDPYGIIQEKNNPLRLNLPPGKADILGGITNPTTTTAPAEAPEPISEGGQSLIVDGIVYSVPPGLKTLTPELTTEMQERIRNNPSLFESWKTGEGAEPVKKKDSTIETSYSDWSNQLNSLPTLDNPWDVGSSDEDITTFKQIKSEKKEVQDTQVQKFINKDNGESKQEVDDMMAVLGWMGNNYSSLDFAEDLKTTINLNDRRGGTFEKNKLLHNIEESISPEMASRIENSDWFKELLNVETSDVTSYHYTKGEMIDNETRDLYKSEYNKDTPGFKDRHQSSKGRGVQQYDNLMRKVTNILDENNIDYTYSASPTHESFGSGMSIVDLLNYAPVLGESGSDSNPIRHNRYSDLFDKIKSRGNNIKLSENETDDGTMVSGLFSDKYLATY